MITVHQIETFEDLQFAMRGSRIKDDPVPMMEQGAVLTVSGANTLRLSGTKKFVLSKEMEKKGMEFIERCVKEAMGTAYVDTKEIWQR
jgi:hypothetical protein